MTKQEFLNKISILVVAENSRRGLPLFSSVVIAQAICETGWGQSQMMMKANAIFGIKAGSSWKGKVYNSKTKECYDGKSYTEIEACFRGYDSLEESISDYFDLITKSSRYRKACIANTPLECITYIKEGGYATSPTYINTIMKIIKDNNLTKYDKENKVNINKFKVGSIYTLQVNLNVRSGAGTNYKKLSKKELTEDGKKNSNIFGVLKKGTKVTCKEIIQNGNDIWLKIPSGFIAGFYKGKDYVK